MILKANAVQYRILDSGQEYVFQPTQQQQQQNRHHLLKKKPRQLVRLSAKKKPQPPVLLLLCSITPTQAQGCAHLLTKKLLHGSILFTQTGRSAVKQAGYLTSVWQQLQQTWPKKKISRRLQQQLHLSSTIHTQVVECAPQLVVALHLG
jgi:hypothetical protein